MLLKELTELNGVSGNEDEVRDYIKSIAVQFADDVRVDLLGNLVVFKKGGSSRYKIMMCAHMDEVGFIASGFADSGALRFRTVGSIDERILPGKRVLVGENKLNGVIGCKPLHLQSKEERKKNTKIKNMYIDIGVDRKEEVEKLVQPGDYISFHSSYQEIGDGCVKAKALDDRSGCSVLLDMLKERYEFDLYICFTVQEEIGLRGSETAAYAINPDIGLIIEGTTCSDVPGVEKYDYSTILGGGAALTVMDRGSYPDKNLVDFIYNLAQKHNIPIQFRQTTTSSNDASSVQRSRGGVKVASISIPCRYIHSPVSILNKNDIESCRQVLGLVLDELSKDREKINTIKNGGSINV